MVRRCCRGSRPRLRWRCGSMRCGTESTLLELASQVTTPTLVAHARGDLAVPRRGGAAARPLTSRKPGSCCSSRRTTSCWRTSRPGRVFWQSCTPSSRPSQRSRRPRSRLSAHRELDVLELVAAGLTNDAIAERLFLSIRTVERHLSNVYVKLRVSGKSGACGGTPVRVGLRDAARTPPTAALDSYVLTPMPAPSSSARSVRRAYARARAAIQRRRHHVQHRSDCHAGEPIATHVVRGGGALRLHVQEWGNPHGQALVFVHGWSQASCAGRDRRAERSSDSFRMVAFDLRGHGMSEKPVDAEHYLDAATVGRRPQRRHQATASGPTGPRRVVLRRVRRDRLPPRVRRGGTCRRQPRRRRGDLRTPGFDHIGPGFLENAGDACGPDLPTNIAAVRRFLRACTAKPLDTTCGAPRCAGTRSCRPR